MLLKAKISSDRRENGSSNVGSSGIRSRFLLSSSYLFFCTVQEVTVHLGGPDFQIVQTNKRCGFKCSFIFNVDKPSAIQSNRLKSLDYF